MFCGKCGNQLNENGVCPVCDAKPVVEEAPIKPMEKFESSSDGFKPLVSAAWFAPGAVLAYSVISIILSRITLLVDTLLLPEIFSYYDYVAETITSAVISGVTQLISAAVLVVATIFLYKMAFKKVNPELKEKSKLIFFLPFAGTWVSGALASVVANTIISIITAILYEALYDYEGATLLTAAISLVVLVINAAITAVIMFILSKKILAKIEEK